MLNKRFLKYPTLLFLIILGGFLRFYRFSDTFTWGTEHSFSLWPIVRIFEDKKLSLIGLNLFNAKSGLFQPPFFNYIFAIPLKLANFNPQILGIIFAVFGLINIRVLFLIGKNIDSKLTGLIAALIYTVSAEIIGYDKIAWIVTPIIITSCLCLYCLNKIYDRVKYSNGIILILGSLVGLGFSLSGQAILMFISFLVFFLTSRKFNQALVYMVGVFLLLSTLIIFNFRHDFIMFKGLSRLFYGEQRVITRSSHNLTGKFNNGLKAFSDLSLRIFALPINNQKLLVNIFCFFAFFILPAVYTRKIGHSKIQRTFVNYYIYTIIISLIGLMIIDQGAYATASIYLWTLIPLWFLILGFCFSKLIKTKFAYLVWFGLLLFTSTNIYKTLRQPATNYTQMISMIDYVLKNANQHPFSLKFIYRDVLVYDYLFYYRAPLYKLKYNQIDLIEQWQPGNPNFYIVHSGYNWNEDRYHVIPYQQVKEFGDIKVITKQKP